MNTKCKKALESKDRRIAELEAQLQAIVLGNPGMIEVPDVQFEMIYEMGQISVIEVIEQSLDPMYEAVKDIESVIGVVTGVIYAYPSETPHTKILNELALKIGDVLNIADAANAKLKADTGKTIDLSTVQNIRATLLKVANGEQPYSALKNAVSQADGLSSIAEILRDVTVEASFDSGTLYLYNKVIETINSEKSTLSIMAAIRKVAKQEEYTEDGVKTAYYRVKRRKSFVT